jgi:DNA-binding transcriptional MerR regulator
MEVLKDKYTITELSEQLSVTTHALRYYEKEFSLPIPKDSRGRRYYPTEYANIMYQIKNMRDDGLEIKAIKKILEDEALLNDPSPVILDDGTMSMISISNDNKSDDIKHFFYEFRDEITHNIQLEAQETRDIIA